MRKWLIVPGSMTVSALLVVAGAAAAATAGGPAHAPALTWLVVHSPNRVTAGGATGNSLDGVSCASTSACTAVGSYVNGIGAQRTLAESWDGTRWSVLPSRNRGRTGNANALFGVSCASPRACMAVGASGLATGGASGLAGAGASGLSIDSLQTLAESWNGTRWSVLPTPNRGTTGDNFDSVSCVSADACMAVGAFGISSNGSGTLAESWDGAHWSVLPTPNPVGAVDGFRGVSCTSADACMAVGSSATSDNGPFTTLAEFWNGSRWSVLPSPNPVAGDNEFNGVSCVSADACTAVGISGSSGAPTVTLIESWNGSRWSVVPSPNGPGLTWLWGVSCAAEDACSAAGLYFAGPPRTLIESWDGTRWSMVPTPSPGVENRVLNGVSCPSATTCTAAGDFFSRAQGAFRTLIETGTAQVRLNR